MNLLTKILESSLSENFQIKYNWDKSVAAFTVNNKTYHITERHIESVRQIIKFKVDYVLKVEDERFSIAGGSVVSLLMYGNPFLINDIDIFPCSEQDYDKLDAKLKESNPIQILENHNSKKFEFANVKIDLVKKFFNTTTECIEQFDFNSVKAGFDNDYKFYSLINYNDLFNFHLVTSQPITTENSFQYMQRLFRYARKGFVIPNNVLVDLFATIQSKNNNKESEEYQLSYTNAFEGIRQTYHHLVVDKTAVNDVPF